MTGVTKKIAARRLAGECHAGGSQDQADAGNTGAPWTPTASGQVWNLLAPDPAAVVWADIGYQLGQIARFGGAARPFVSVAQHSVLVADLAPAHLRLHALLHDAHEAILGDWTTPVKQALSRLGDCRGFDELERRTALAIHQAAGIEFLLNAADAAALHHADMVALATEKRDAMAASPAPWPGLPEPDPREINFLPPPEAERLWLDHLRAAGVSTSVEDNQSNEKASPDFDVVDASLDAAADRWASNIGLTRMIKDIVSVSRLNPGVPKLEREKMIARQEALISDVVINAYREGVMRMTGAKYEEG